MKAKVYEKITRADIKAIERGGVKNFACTSAGKALSGRTTVYTVGRLTGRKYKVLPCANPCILSVQRIF
jgi:hypothetical protein